MTKYVVMIVLLWHFMCCVSIGYAVGSSDIVRLKKAGVSDRVIVKIIRSNAIARALLSVEEVIEMKAAQVGDEVILALIEGGSTTVPELDREDALDRALKRQIDRQEMVVMLQKKELDVLVAYLTALITNPEVVKLVHEGKLASEDYAAIVKYLKQYALGEETREYGEGDDITIDIKKLEK
jgi:hypothetical protein